MTGLGAFHSSDRLRVCPCGLGRNGWSHIIKFCRKFFQCSSMYSDALDIIYVHSAADNAPFKCYQYVSSSLLIPSISFAPCVCE